MKTSIYSTSGHTLLEVLAASLLVAMVFVTMASLYVTSLRFLGSGQPVLERDSVFALETIVRNARLAEEAVVDNGGMQLKLRIDSNAPNPGTPQTADDLWISYRFVGGGLRTRISTVGGAAIDVAAGDPEVIAGLAPLTGVGQSRFDLQSGISTPAVDNVVDIEIWPDTTRRFIAAAALIRSERA